MDLQGAFSAVAHSNYVVVALVLVALDFVTGVVSALRRGTFTWHKIGDILPVNVLSALGAFGLQVVEVMRSGSVDLWVGAAFAVLAATLIQSIASNLDELTGIGFAKYTDQVTGWLTGWLRKGSGGSPAPTGGQPRPSGGAPA